jgi:hypothetical protein
MKGVGGAETRDGPVGTKGSDERTILVLLRPQAARSAAHPRQMEPPVSNASTMSEALIERGAMSCRAADPCDVGYYGIAVLGPAGVDPVPCMRCNHPVAQHDEQGCCLLGTCTSIRCAAGGRRTTPDSEPQLRGTCSRLPMCPWRPEQSVRRARPAAGNCSWTPRSQQPLSLSGPLRSGPYPRRVRPARPWFF